MGDTSSNIPSNALRGGPTGGRWNFACDSYGKVRHSRKACVYAVVNHGDGEKIVTLAGRIECWGDAQLFAASRDLAAVCHAFLEGVVGICGAHNGEAAFMEKIEDMAKAALTKAGLLEEGNSDV